VNSEELELSLRTEFENYLKGVFAGMQQDVADFQKNFESEFEKHKSQMDDAFRDLSTRFKTDVSFDQAFTESVVEHLRLARDDGAQLSAQAFADAEELKPKVSSIAGYDLLRDAINDIGSQLTQSAILKSLVDNASMFTPRGAFFIVKNDNLICWRKFDRDGHSDDESIRNISFPLSADTLLADAVHSLGARAGSNAEDAVFLDALGFGRPDRMFAIPLTARGRGVAVFYADAGNEASDVNLEALESLVRVAGLTVELRAAAAVQPAIQEAPAHAAIESEENIPAAEPASETLEPTPVYAEEPVSDADQIEEYSGIVEVEEPHAPEGAEYAEPVSAEIETASADESGYFEPETVEHEPAEVETEYAAVAESEESSVEPVSDFAFASSDSYDASDDAESAPTEDYAYAGETRNGGNGHGYESVQEPVVEVSAPQPKTSRLSDRHVDLPIEVAEDERRLHNDARRFARLLVSEIKLYNEQKVHEGRDAADLYERLREAIDRSREMYEKRVQPQVAAKFDYFHYELVTNLAEGNDVKLGTGYPGSTV
jgi:hypothetical protein